MRLASGWNVHAQTQSEFVCIQKENKFGDRGIIGRRNIGNSDLKGGKWDTWVCLCANNQWRRADTNTEVESKITVRMSENIIRILLSSTNMPIINKSLCKPIELEDK